MKNRIYGVIGIRSMMANWNADFTGFPKTTSSGEVFGSDKALKYPMKKKWENEGEKVLYVKSLKVDSGEGKKGEIAVRPKSLRERYDEIFEANPNINGAVIFNSTCYILGNYLKARGMQSVKLVGYDLIGRNTQLLSEGVITALIAQRPERQGYDGIKSLCNHLLFKQGSEKVNLMPIDILLKENLKYYLNNKL